MEASAGRQELVSGAWSSDDRLGRTDSPPLEWSSPPVFQRLVNRRISGDEDTGLLEWFASLWEDLPFDQAISLGCSFCENERRLIDLGVCREIVCVDISAKALLEAEKLKGDREMTFVVKDIESDPLPDGPYDAAFCFSSLHHISNLAAVMKGLYERMTPDAPILVHEYVGPTRFQWQRQVCETANDIFRLLPERYR